MIDDAEIHRRAATLGVQPYHVERDYVINHILAHLTADPGMLIFRGGTALARVYWPDFRLSEDLDFITPGGRDDVERVQSAAVRRARESTGIDLRHAFHSAGPDRTQSMVDWTTQWESAGSIQIDVATKEQPALPEERRQLNLPYTDLAPDLVLPVLQLDDILGSKWGMLDDRDEPRDLFDIWFALTAASVPFDALVRGHRARYGYDPMPSFIRRAERLRQSWQDRLAYQMRNLPDFDAVLSDVRSVVSVWESGRC